MTGGAGRDDWDDDDHYPMHPAHPRWDERSATVTRLRLVVVVLFAVVTAAAGLVMLWQYATR